MARASRLALGIHLRIAVFRRDGYRCQHCGKVAGPAELEVDHVVPRSLDGPDEFENLQTLCRTCNRRKGARFSA
jgi:5-methylcytosine-specific restriction endonuclease McrA